MLSKEVRDGVKRELKVTWRIVKSPWFWIGYLVLRFVMIYFGWN